MRPFRGWKWSLALWGRCLRSLAACQTKYGWCCEGKSLSREDEMVVAPICNGLKSAHLDFAEDSIPHFVVFSVLSSTFSEPYRKNCVKANNPPKSKAELWTSIVNSRPRALVCGGGGGGGEEGQNASQGTYLQGEFFWKASCTTETLGEKNLKNRPLAHAPIREEIIVNQSQRKAKSKYGICARFWFDRRGHKSQAVARSIQIYIANDEKLSQHETLGLAKARPK